MGAYIILFPRARVFTLVWLGFFVTSFALPAWLMLGYWMVLQVVGGLGGAETRRRLLGPWRRLRRRLEYLIRHLELVIEVLEYFQSRSGIDNSELTFFQEARPLHTCSRSSPFTAKPVTMVSLGVNGCSN